MPFMEVSVSDCGKIACNRNQHSERHPVSDFPPPANAAQRLVMQIAALATTARLSAAIMHHLDRFIMRRTHQRTSATSILTGLPLIWLTTVGAQSGKSRTVPLLAINDGNALILIASNWGQQQHPSWYYNLRAHPQVQVQRGSGFSISYTTREVADTEYDRCWALAVSRYPGYTAYRRRTTRHIPIFRLEQSA